MRISDWSSDVCSSDLEGYRRHPHPRRRPPRGRGLVRGVREGQRFGPQGEDRRENLYRTQDPRPDRGRSLLSGAEGQDRRRSAERRSEEHTSELKSLMRISYAVFCLKKKTNK